MENNSKKSFWFFFLLFLFLGYFYLSFPAEFMTDSAHYLWGARFLAIGQGYKTYNAIAPGLVPIISWPPCFSALMAIFLRLTSFGEIGSFKAANFSAFTLYAFSCAGIILSVFKTRHFRLLALCFVFIPVVWRYLNLILSEMLFMAVLMAAAWTFLKAYKTHQGTSKYSLFITSGTLCLLLGLTRFPGVIAVIPCAVIIMASPTFTATFSQRIKGAILFLLPSILGMSAWLARNKLVAGYFTYLTAYRKYPSIPNSFETFADFVRNSFLVISGFTWTGWSGGIAGYLPAFLFYSILVILLVIAFDDIRKKNFDLRTVILGFMTSFLFFYLF